MPLLYSFPADCVAVSERYVDNAGEVSGVESRELGEASVLSRFPVTIRTTKWSYEKLYQQWEMAKQKREKGLWH